MTAIDRAILSSYILTVDYDVSNNPIYLGRALINSAKSDAVWQIRKLTFDGANNLTDIRFANGSQEFNMKWDDRASLTYS